MMRMTIRRWMLAGAVLGMMTHRADAGLFTIYYGDDDGFGVGAISGQLDPNVDRAGPGESPFTDIRLIGGGLGTPIR